MPIVAMLRRAAFQIVRKGPVNTGRAALIYMFSLRGRSELISMQITERIPPAKFRSGNTRLRRRTQCLGMVMSHLTRETSCERSVWSKRI